jgi:hypothetical protein
MQYLLECLAKKISPIVHLSSSRSSKSQSSKSHVACVAVAARDVPWQRARKRWHATSGGGPVECAWDILDA